MDRGRHRLRAPCRAIIAGLCLALAAAGGGTPIRADWKFKDEVAGKPRNEAASDSDKASDISGLACDRPSGFPRLCLIADDQAPGVQVVILKEDGGEAGATIPLVTDLFVKASGKRVRLELDVEGVAYAKGAFYVAGSHGRPRHEPTPLQASAQDRAEAEAKTRASSHLFRIQFPAGSVDMGSGKLVGAAPRITEARPLAGWIKADPVIGPFWNRRLDEKGVTIEGIAVLGDELCAGFREPVGDDGTASMLCVPLDALFGAGNGKARRVEFALGTYRPGAPRGIRDLVACGSGLLVLAGPATDPPDGAVANGDYTLSYYSGGRLWPLLALPSQGSEVKPEALVPLEVQGKQMRALILSDGPKEGGGKIVTFALP